MTTCGESPIPSCWFLQRFSQKGAAGLKSSFRFSTTLLLCHPDPEADIAFWILPCCWMDIGQPVKSFEREDTLLQCNCLWGKVTCSSGASLGLASCHPYFICTFHSKLKNIATHVLWTTHLFLSPFSRRHTNRPTGNVAGEVKTSSPLLAGQVFRLQI